MKFRVTFKNPDSVSNAISCMVNESMEDEEVLAHPDAEIVFENNLDCIRGTIIDELTEFTESWVIYGEYITIEFDTEARTATVVKR